MAIITGSAYRTYTPGLLASYFYGDIIAVTATTVTNHNSAAFDSSSDFGTFTGTFSMLLSGDVVGEVNGYSFYYSSKLMGSITGLHLDAATVFTLAGTHDINSILEAMFAGDDVFNLQHLQYDYRTQIVNALGGNDLVNGSFVQDLVFGGSGRDSVHGGLSQDSLHGDTGDDLLWGDGGNDVLWGNAGKDSLYGGWDNDTLMGGAGNDVMEGSLGTDRLQGDEGGDLMSGGLGSDLFVLKTEADSLDTTPGRDTVTDFSTAEGDKIDLRALDANHLRIGNQKFHFVASAAFSHHAGELRYEATADGCVVSGDTDGDGTADFAMVLQHVSAVLGTDFIL